VKIQLSLIVLLNSKSILSSLWRFTPLRREHTHDDHASSGSWRIS
jgi:hypothetical protein